ncbi:hypothetical protein [Paenibacillus sp. 7523-1]|uniref:hypothetical protein n=1 Tax=Paenibacillus sp. 7523-1 TaxID=2022550 RepID=UPI000BA69F21|nr:hypothetical protein [Paenibacillus sp. 7523-1]PAD30703.1 hypothetical protein CHH60_12105 [Paenibacillus sp. 7523-1]
MPHANSHKSRAYSKKWGFILPLTILILVISGCSLERDEHTVRFQQLQQPNVTDDLPVWLDVYSKSVHEEVYSPQGNSELLP